MNPASVDYHRRAGAYVKSNPTDYVMIRSKATGADLSRQNEILADWFTYFTVRGQRETIATFRHLLKSGRDVMFPCSSPETFDRNYTAPQYRWRDPDRRTADQSSGPRRDMRPTIERTLASLRGARVHGAKPSPVEIAEPPKSPHQWLDEYRADPPPMPKLSPRLRANLGLPQEQPEDSFEGLDAGGDRE